MKRFVSLIVSIIILAGSIYSQSVIAPKEKSGGFARVYAMGGENGMNYFMIDPIAMRYNPAFSKYYSNFLWGNIGASTAAPNDGDGQMAGFNFALDNKLTIGAILTRNDYTNSGISDIGFANGLVGVLNGIPTTSRTAVRLDNNFEVLASYSLSESTVLGAAVAYAATNNDFTPASGTAVKSDASQFGFGLGIIQHFSKDQALEASFDMKFGSAKHEGASTNKVSGNTIGMSARYFHNIGKGFTFVPIVSYYTESSKIEAGSTTTDLPTYGLFHFGTGINYTTGDLFLAGGVSFMYETVTNKATSAAPELSNSSVMFPVWNLGAEFKLTEWLKARAGYQVSTMKNNTQSAASATTKDESATTAFNRTGVTLGLGFKFGNFNLDATFNDQVLLQGFKNLSTGAANTFGFISASYAF